jgi:serine protease Do
MQYPRAFGLIALSLAWLMPSARAEPDRAAMIALANSLWKVEVQRAQGGYSLGSGVSVAADQVLTNCHVTREGRAITVVRGGARWRVDAQAVDAEHDLCVLRVPNLGAIAVPLGRSAALQPGQPVHALGYTGGLELAFSQGHIDTLHRLDGARVIQSSNAFTSGASGGGLFDDELNLVGVLTFRLRGGEQHYFSAPTDWIRALIKDPSRFVEVRPLAPEPLAFWQRPLAAQPDFLRAVVLEREQRWNELEALAQDWTRADATDPQPWYLHGLALGGLKRWREAQRALEQSVALEPNLHRALYRLGIALTEQDQLDGARAMRGRLESLKSELAPALGRIIDTR